MRASLGVEYLCLCYDSNATLALKVACASAQMCATCVALPSRTDAADDDDDDESNASHTHTLKYAARVCD